MKKILILPMLIIPFAACNAESEQTPVQVIETALLNAGDSAIVATGSRGYTAIKVPATPELLEIYAGEKNGMFLSATADMKLDEVIEAETCLINNDTEYNTYRVFCGTADDILTPSDTNGYWAVLINKQ